MRQSERAARESDHRRESDHQRWADDGGFDQRRRGANGRRRRMGPCGIDLGGAGVGKAGTVRFVPRHEKGCGILGEVRTVTDQTAPPVAPVLCRASLVVA